MSSQMSSLKSNNAADRAHTDHRPRPPPRVHRASGALQYFAARRHPRSASTNHLVAKSASAPPVATAAAPPSDANRNAQSSSSRSPLTRPGRHHPISPTTLANARHAIITPRTVPSVTPAGNDARRPVARSNHRRPRSATGAHLATRAPRPDRLPHSPSSLPRTPSVSSSYPPIAALTTIRVVASQVLSPRNPSDSGSTATGRASRETTGQRDGGGLASARRARRRRRRRRGGRCPQRGAASRGIVDGELARVRVRDPRAVNVAVDPAPRQRPAAARGGLAPRGAAPVPPRTRRDRASAAPSRIARAEPASIDRAAGDRRSGVVDIDRPPPRTAAGSKGTRHARVTHRTRPAADLGAPGSPRAPGMTSWVRDRLNRVQPAFGDSPGGSDSPRGGSDGEGSRRGARALARGVLGALQWPPSAPTRAADASPVPQGHPVYLPRHRRPGRAPNPADASAQAVARLPRRRAAARHAVHPGDPGRRRGPDERFDTPRDGDPRGRTGRRADLPFRRRAAAGRGGHGGRHARVHGGTRRRARERRRRRVPLPRTRRHPRRRTTRRLRPRASTRRDRRPARKRCYSSAGPNRPRIVVAVRQRSQGYDAALARAGSAAPRTPPRKHLVSVPIVLLAQLTERVPMDFTSARVVPGGGASGEFRSLPKLLESIEPDASDDRDVVVVDARAANLRRFADAAGRRSGRWRIRRSAPPRWRGGGGGPAVRARRRRAGGAVGGGGVRLEVELGRLTFPIGQLRCGLAGTGVVKAVADRLGVPSRLVRAGTTAAARTRQNVVVVGGSELFVGVMRAGAIYSPDNPAYAELHAPTCQRN